ncbi:MAG: polyprenyl diphosphate synthase [Patescibacteria group bacterium]
MDRRASLGRGAAAEHVLATIPRHVAIIMDGNGRWARSRGLPRSAGHRAGFERLEEIIRACVELGVEFLTLYAFSTENWHRPPEEVDFLLRLFAEGVTAKLGDLHRQGARLRFIGRRDRLPAGLVEAMSAAERKTEANRTINLTIALDYGARDEIAEAARSLARRVAAGELDPAAIDQEAIGAALYTAALPDLDLLIRPGGESRLSNFLLWQSAYAELWFTPVYWPDFGRKQLMEALAAFGRRERRFGRA